MPLCFQRDGMMLSRHCSYSLTWRGRWDGVPGRCWSGSPSDLAGMAFPAVAGVAAPITKDCSGRNLKCTRVDVHTEEQELSRENNEAIVVGAVGSGAPWFLTGWAEGTEVEFMIDTGCQVTILTTSVFERMCASDPRVRCHLRRCGRRLISADFVLWYEGNLI